MPPFTTVSIVQGPSTPTPTPTATGITTDDVITEKNGSRSVCFGWKAKLEHNDCVVLGGNTRSKYDNSVQLLDFTLADNNLLMDDGKLMVGKMFDTICGGCGESHKYGIRWEYEESSNTSTPPIDIVHNNHIGVCFMCIRDVVVEKKAKESWEARVGKRDEIDRLRKELDELKSKVAHLTNKH